jgi:DNA-binding response OmpR family regulator
VVEDDRGARAGLVALLTEEGFEVSEAETGADAISALQRPPVVALVDYRLPDIDGASLIRAIREKAAGCKCIMVTGSADLHIDEDGEAHFSDRATEAAEAGAAGYLSKPVDFAELLALVHRILG